MKTLKELRSLSADDLNKYKKEITKQFKTDSPLEVKKIIQKQCEKIDKVLAEKTQITNNYLVVFTIEDTDTTTQKIVTSRTIEKAIEYLKLHNYNTNEIHSIIKL